MNRYLVTFSDGKYKHRYVLHAHTFTHAYEIFMGDFELSPVELISIVKL
jgi:hypothetical protein